MTQEPIMYAVRFVAGDGQPYQWLVDDRASADQEAASLENMGATDIEVAPVY